MSEPSLFRRSRAQVKVAALAADQGGVISLRQAYAIGVTRAQVRADVRALRWRRVGRQCLAVHTGELGQEGQLWSAVLDAGPRACLDGASSLVAAGLKNFSTDSIRVSLPRGAKVVRSAQVDVRQTRRLRPDDLVGTGVPRTRNEVAAIRAALWARSDREAELVLTMAVQQKLTTPVDLAGALLLVRRDRRRMLVNETVLEISGGAQSLGEIDVARACRDRGLPEPSRQSLRKGPFGRYFLDIVWERFGVVVEVDGIHHAWAENVVGDALRQNTLAIQGALVLKLPLLGLRHRPDDFYAQVDAALQSRGWRRGWAA